MSRDLQSQDVSSQGLQLLREIRGSVTQNVHEASQVPRVTQRSNHTADPFSSTHKLSDALESVREIVQEEARAEQTQRLYIQRAAEAERQAEIEAHERSIRADVESRLQSEADRQRELHLSRLRSSYEASIQRGEDAELPPELAELQDMNQTERSPLELVTPATHQASLQDQPAPSRRSRAQIGLLISAAAITLIFVIAHIRGQEANVRLSDQISLNTVNPADTSAVNSIAGGSSAHDSGSTKTDETPSESTHVRQERNCKEQPEQTQVEQSQGERAKQSKVSQDKERTRSGRRGKRGKRGKRGEQIKRSRRQTVAPISIDFNAQ